MADLWTRSNEMPLCERFYEASSACDEMGTLLINSRREDEGQFWRSWAFQFWREAEAANQREKRPLGEEDEDGCAVVKKARIESLAID
jgi:hypothetical protein